MSPGNTVKADEENDQGLKFCLSNFPFSHPFNHGSPTVLGDSASYLMLAFPVINLTFTVR